MNNFGDMLGPFIVERILAKHHVDPCAARADRRLLSVGSVLHFARNQDVIWGTGVNGKILASDYLFSTLDVRAVRGPRTRDFLTNRGIDAPPVFGDPALLLPILFPEIASWATVKEHAVTVVPNLNDLRFYEPSPTMLDPRSSLEVCLRRIAQSEFVVGSSLHGIVVAESLGIPARLIASTREDPLKYQDYYLGTGRPDPGVAATVGEAVEMGGERRPDFDAPRLLHAFPLDLWITT